MVDYDYVRLYWNGSLSRRTQLRDPRFLQLRFFLRPSVLEWLRFPGEPCGFIAPLRWFEEDLGCCVSFFDDWPMMLVIMAGMNQKESYAARRPRSLTTSAAACTWLVLRVTSFHAVFPSVVGMLKMLAILVGMDQRDSTSLVVFFGNGMCTVGSVGSMQIVLCSLRLSAGPLPSLLGRSRGLSPGLVDNGVDMPVIVPTLVQTRSRL